MIVTIHQAIYGERQLGHGLLANTGSVSAAQMENLTDRPSLAPPGTAWRPYLSGFRYGDDYVLMRTFPDSQASRSGMVFSHALIAPAKQLSVLATLRSLVNLLPKAPGRPSQLEPVTLTVSHTCSGPDTKAIPGYSSVVTKLLDPSTRLPIVWLGQDHFEDVICALWYYLWPTARVNLSFRLSFGPNDTDGQKLTIVSTPAPLANRWHDAAVVRPSETSPVANEAVALLTGDSRGEALRNFMESVEAPLLHVTDLGLLETCRRYLDEERLSEDAVRSLVRLVAVLFPEPTEAVSVKARALRMLSAATRAGTPGHVSALRNLDLAPFSTPKEVLDAVGDWVRDTAVPGLIRGDAGFVGVFAQAVAIARRDGSWGRSILEALEGSLRQWLPVLAGVVWILWTESAALVPHVGDALPAEERVETALAGAVPRTVTLPISSAVERYAVGRGWTRLHGATVAIAYSAVVAYEKQLLVEKDGIGVSGLGEIASRVPETATVDMAVRTAEVHLVELAARFCANHPQLLHRLDLQCPSGRRIFAKSLDLNDSVWVGLDDPAQTVSLLIRSSVSGEAVEPTIWPHIARSPYGDLSKDPERASLWDGLPKDAAQHLLPSTARGWITAALGSPTSAAMPEPALAASVVSELNRRDVLERITAGQAHPFVVLFAVLPLAEGVLLEWLNLYRQPLAPGDAMEIGSLIATRRWSTCAKTVSTRVLRGVRDLIPTLRQCESLLGFWDRMELQVKGTLEQHPFSVDELWAAFLDLATTLYPSGPDERHLWERAGGDMAGLEFYGSGRDRWHRAIFRVRHGDRVAPSDLVAVMRADYPQNSVLYWLGRQDLFKS